MKRKIYNLLVFLILLIGNMQAQDYLISFNGSGASTTVESVRVENITQGTELTLSGNDLLHLISIVTGIEQISGDSGNKVTFSPNPVNSNTHMKFFLPSPGLTTITINDISGRMIFSKQDNLSNGEHIYSIEGFDRGIYFVTISSGRYSVTGRLVSNESHRGDVKMTYENSVSVEKNTYGSKGSKGEVVMQYNPNDRLIFTATGGECITTVSDLVSSSKTITFDFYPCKDGDNNKYSTVKIGNQIWMAANLKTTKYNNGDPISLVTDNAAWLELRYEAAYCWYDNDESNYKNIFGALYNFWAVSPGNLCPVGWHVPDYNEFSILENYLINNGYNYDNLTYGNSIGKSLASTAMISLTTLPSTPSIMWEYSSDEGTVGNYDFPLKRNATGFSALPSGFRWDGFSVINKSAYWWSSSEVSMGFARYRDLQSNWESLLGGYTYEWTGYSVRCLKNN